MFIHIGAHKTGTTYLRHRVFPDMSIHYSRAISLELCYFLDEDSDVYPGKEGDLDKIKDYVNACEGNVLLSHESYMGNPKNGYKHFERNVNKIKEVFPEAHVILVTRERERWIRSLYGEMTYSQNETRSFDTFKASFSFDQELAVHYLKETLRHVHIISYELFKSDRDAFLKKVEEITEAKFFGNHADPIRPGLTAIQVQAMRLANYLRLSRRMKMHIRRLIP
jgi:hypothetical protein